LPIEYSCENLTRRGFARIQTVHQMGEARRKREMERLAVAEVCGLELPTGKIRVLWDQRAAATPLGQMPYFIEFLHVSGLWRNWLEDCPLSYTSPNAPGKADVLGTWLLSILSGHNRYSHVTALRNDGVNPGLLGMARILSEDALRRALRHLAEREATTTDWMHAHLRNSAWGLLSADEWILDVDATVKPLYGHQEGAVLGFNPHKPGRPSHVNHTYWASPLRLALHVDVQPGNCAHAKHSVPGLLDLLEALGPTRKPFLVRGDKSFGSDEIMQKLEARDQPYLFKLRMSKGVQRTVRSLWTCDDWVDAGQGWEARESTIRLMGWDRERRIVVLRRPIKGELALEDQAQQILGFIEARSTTVKAYEYAVLVTTLAAERFDLPMIAQLYRDRADCENGFDELKNQWGWGGYTTQDLARCRLSAQAVALIYNWWNLYLRMVDPRKHREAITARPLLLTAVARISDHANQRLIRITPLHAFAKQAITRLQAVSTKLKECKRNAEQLPDTTPWQLICQHLRTVLLALNRLRCPFLPPPALPESAVNCFF
jgi:hypothetical protein